MYSKRLLPTVYIYIAMSVSKFSSNVYRMEDHCVLHELYALVGTVYLYELHL